MSNETKPSNGAKPRGPGWTGDIILVEVWNDRWATQRVDSKGVVLGSEEGDGSKLPKFILDGDSPAVFVCWQKERIGAFLGNGYAEKRAVVDLYQLAWVLCSTGEISARRLEDVAAWCGAKGKMDTAAERVFVVRDCYFRMMDRLALGLEVEGFGRELAKKVTDVANNAIGGILGRITEPLRRNSTTTTEGTP